MEMKRRTVLAAGMAALGTTLSEQAISCTIVPSPKPVRFSDHNCQQEIREFVRMLNEAPAMEVNDVEEWVEKRSFYIGDEYFGRPDVSSFLRTYRISDGKLDSKPIRLTEIQLIRQRKNLASYAFTLRRYRYHAADWEGCNGLMTHDEYWGEEEAAYIAAFRNNRMTRLREFPEWFANDEAAV